MNYADAGVLALIAKSYGNVVFTNNTLQRRFIGG
jgi:hypothetical protein